MRGATNAQDAPSSGVSFVVVSKTYASGDYIQFSLGLGTSAKGVSLANGDTTFSFAKGYKYLIICNFTPSTVDGGIQGIGAIQGYANAKVWDTGGFSNIVDARDGAKSGSIQNTTSANNTFVWFQVTILNLGGGRKLSLLRRLFRGRRS